MPGSLSYTLQTVNGDPATTGKNINITTGTVSDVVFNEVGVVSLSDVATGDTITVGGLVYTYEFLGAHDVRGDPLQPAAYIRITSVPAGGTLSIGDTFAMDLTGVPGDPDYPNLQNGNTQGKVSALDTTTPISFPGYVCFAAGTTILTPDGEVAVEALRTGDLVETADDGAQPVLWIGSNKVDFVADNDRQKPILVRADALGKAKPKRDLVLSPQHKILLANANCQGVLAPAKGLATQNGIRRMNGRRRVEYFHVLLPMHSIVFSEGLATESFYPGETAMKMLTAKQRTQILAAVPSLRHGPSGYGPQVRVSLTRGQAQELPKGQLGFGFGEITVERLSA